MLTDQTVYEYKPSVRTVYWGASLRHETIRKSLKEDDDGEHNMPALGRDPDDFANREAVEVIQRRKLASLGKRLAANQDWVDHFASAGMRAEDLSKPGALAATPTLEKADLRHRYPAPSRSGEGISRAQSP